MRWIVQISSWVKLKIQSWERKPVITEWYRLLGTLACVVYYIYLAKIICHFS